MKRLSRFLSLSLLTIATLIAMAIPAAAASENSVLKDYGVYIIASAVVVVLAILLIVLKAGKGKKNEPAPEETATPATEEKSEDASPVVEEAPAEEPAPVEEVAPVVEETPAEEVAPVVEETPVEEPAPVVEAAPAEEPAPVVEEPAPVVEEAPAEEPKPAPVVEAAPAEEPAPVVEETKPEGVQPEFVELSDDYAIEAKELPAEAVDPETGCVYTFNENGIPVPPEGKIIRYKWSFLARISQAHAEVKEHYMILRRTLLAYKKMRSNVSWNFDSYFVGRKTVAKLKIRGKNLVVYFPIDPKEMEGSKYVGEDASKISRYKAVPFAYSINGTRKLKYAIELIERVCESAPEKEPQLVATEDIEKALPVRDFDTLYNRELIKIGGFISVGSATSDEDDE